MTAMDRARGWLFDILAHHQAESLRTNRAITRKTMGVPMEDYAYPGQISGQNTTVNQQAAGFLKPALMGAALLAAGAAGIGLLKSTPAVAPIAAVSPAPPQANKGWIAIYEEQQPDGTWKESRRETLK